MHLAVNLLLLTLDTLYWKCVKEVCNHERCINTENIIVIGTTAIGAGLMSIGDFFLLIY